MLAKYGSLSKSFLAHAAMRFADELVLEVAAEGQAKACEEMAGAGDGFEDVVDFSSRRVEFEEKALGALLYVHRRCGVEEAEAGRVVDGFLDAAHVQGPEAEGMGFHGDDLVEFDGRGGVGYAGPSVVEHGPTAEGLFCCCKGGFAATDAGAGRIVNEAEGKMRGWIEAV